MDAKSMKKPTPDLEDDLRPEYDFHALPVVAKGPRRGEIGMFFKKLLATCRERRRMALFPEGAYHVSWDDTTITCTSPSGDVQSVPWQDLQSVVIRTTDQGPFVADVFWILQGSGSTCVIPQGAKGEPELLRRLQELPGFKIDGMNSADNAEFLCWSRKEL